jgi:phage gpG-like protein
MKRVDAEKKEFDASLIRMQGTRAVFTRLSTEVYTNLGMDILREEIRKTREAMEKSYLSLGLRESIKHFFAQVRLNLIESNKKTDEISEMMVVMYRKLSTEHGLALSAPMPFSLDKYIKELDAIEVVYQKQFNATTMLTTTRVALMRKFFDSVAARVKQNFLQANKDVEAWQKVVMAPLEAQIREHKNQLKNRMQSIQRIHVATDSLEDKIASFETLQAEVDAQKQGLQQMQDNLKAALSADLKNLKVAA